MNKKKVSGKKILKTPVIGGLHVLQHLSVVTGAILIAVVVAGSTFFVDSIDGRRTYTLTSEAKDTDFEDSRIFNQMLGEKVSDIICFGAIRGQMEADGVFNGKKEVDVTAFVNRYNGIPTEYITARYYLEDLIKWAQNGFDYKEMQLSGEEADQFLSRMRTVTRINFASGNYNGDAVSYLNSDFDSITRTEDVSGNIFGDEPIRDDVAANILTNRYPSVEGKNIEKYVSSWSEYYELCSNIEKAATDLEINYGEYLKYEELYNTNNTNIRYCIRKTVGDHTEIYSNMDLSGKTINDIQQAFLNECGKYLFYNPTEMTYQTNTLIEEATLRYIVNGYQYAYPEDTQVWIGVASPYQTEDAITIGKAYYNSYTPYYWYLLLGTAACLLIYAVLLVILTMQTGRRVDEEEKIYIRLRPEDRIPTEIMALAGTAVIAGIFLGLYNATRYWIWNDIHQAVFLAVCGVIALACSILVSWCYYSFVRRIKGGWLWQNSLCRRLVNAIRKAVVYIYDNASVLIRVWLPFLLFVSANILLIYLLKEIGILAAMVLDILAGTFLYQSARARETIVAGIIKIRDGDLKHKIDEKTLHGDNLVLAQAINSIGEGIKNAVETSMKDERMKADLITNVSHDIKTPLTSIINYIDLIKRENIINEKVRKYVEILDTKSQRLKQLTDDLVEASKISSGNISLKFERINLVELVNQTIGEFSEKFDLKSLETVVRTDKNALFIEADSRRIWRVIENLFNNICKYALSGTRVYMDIYEMISADKGAQVILSVKNISEQPLTNVNPEEVTERFIRGDVARSTEGSGLGLSIAKSLTEAQNGSFQIQIDGDLFKVVLIFPLLEK